MTFIFKTTSIGSTHPIPFLSSHTLLRCASLCCSTSHHLVSPPQPVASLPDCHSSPHRCLEELLAITSSLIHLRFACNSSSARRIEAPANESKFWLAKSKLRLTNRSSSSLNRRSAPAPSPECVGDPSLKSTALASLSPSIFHFTATPQGSPSGAPLSVPATSGESKI